MFWILYWLLYSIEHFNKSRLLNLIGREILLTIVALVDKASVNRSFLFGGGISMMCYLFLVASCLS